VCYSTQAVIGVTGWLVIWVCDPVADAGDGLDERRVAEFATEPADGDLNRFRERVGVFVPCLGEEVFGAEDAGGLL